MKISEDSKRLLWMVACVVAILFAALALATQMGCAPLGSTPVAEIGMRYTQVVDLYGPPSLIVESGMPEGEFWAVWTNDRGDEVERCRFKQTVRRLEDENGRQIVRVSYELVERIDSLRNYGRPW